MKFSTKAIHAGQQPDPTTGAVMTPVFLTSTYVQEGLGKNKGYEYSRVSNPTRTALEKNIASLENAEEGMAFASGMAAIDALFRLLSPGDHMIVTNNVYGGTYRIAKMVFEQYGLQFDFINTTDMNSIVRARKPNTKMIFVETPTNPTMEITDLGAIAKFSRTHQLISVVDNTFATPYLQRPIEFGIDVVVHSVTKYLNGHSDMLGGVVVTNKKEVVEKLRFNQKAVGGIMSPFDAWLCLRGTKTLAVPNEAALRECDDHRRVAGSAEKNRQGQLPGPAKPSSIRAGQKADERIWRDDFVRRRELEQRQTIFKTSTGLRTCRESWGRRDAYFASSDDDTRIRSEVGAHKKWCDRWIGPNLCRYRRCGRFD